MRRENRVAPRRSKRRKKVLAVLGMGGHTSQMLRMFTPFLDQFEEDYRFEYLVGHDDKTSVNKIKRKGKVHVMRNPRLMTDKSITKVVFKMVPSTIDAFLVLWRSNPDVVISAGPSMTIPLFWLAKLMGRKTIFIESWVRVHHGSITGRLVYPVSDLFLVQWETMKKQYPRAVYAGRLS